MLKKSKVGLVVGLWALYFVVGCASVSERFEQRKQKIDSPQSEPSKDSEVHVITSEESVGDTWLKQPQPQEPLAPPKVGLILGPGGVKAFAHTGVIKELVKAKIPIDSIIGIEWGALPAALYAENGKVHGAEWKLYKLEQKDLAKRGFFTKKLEANSINTLSEFFEKNLEKSDIGSMQVDFACPSLSIYSGTLSWQQRGSVMEALKKCMPYPPLFQPNDHWVAGAFSVDEAISRMKAAKIEVIVFVNVLSDGEPLKQDELKNSYVSAVVWQELIRHLKKSASAASYVVNVNTRNYKLLDFGSARSIFSAGEQAGEKAARELAKKYGF